MNKREFEQYLTAERRFSKHTIKAYLDDLSQFLSFLEEEYGISGMDDVDHRNIRNWVVHLVTENNLSSRSVNRKLSALKTYFKFLIREQIITSDPMAKVIAPKTEKRLPEFVDEKSMLQLESKEVFDDSLEGKRDRLVIELFYQTGMRRAEMINIDLKDIDLPGKSLVVTGKRNKQRIVPLSAHIIKVMRVYLSERNELFGDSGRLILTSKGKPAYPELIYRIVRSYLSMVTTITKKSPHVLRHTFATHMLNNGADLNTIKELLGHANLSATQVYTHNTFEKLKSIYNQAHPRA